jgi:hypothetical protein
MTDDTFIDIQEGDEVGYYGEIKADESREKHYGRIDTFAGRHSGIA